MADTYIEPGLVCIYGLVDPVTQELRYVGKTTAPLHRRLLAHLNDVRRGRTFIPRHRWLNGLLKKGASPDIFEIETVPIDGWQEAEQFWIGYFRFVGFDLLNATAGGDGLQSFRHRTETRERQSAAALARYKRPGERERTGKSVSSAYGRHEAKQNLRDGRKKVSVSSRQIGLNALISYQKSPEGRAAASARSKGRVVSEETRAKISARNKGKRWTSERKEAQRRRRLGKKHSEETKAKIRASADSHRISVAGRAKWADNAYREKRKLISAAISEKMKRGWADPAFRKMRLMQQRRARRLTSDSETNC